MMQGVSVALKTTVKVATKRDRSESVTAKAGEAEGIYRVAGSRSGLPKDPGS